MHIQNKRKELTLEAQKIADEVKQLVARESKVQKLLDLLAPKPSTIKRQHSF